MLAAGGGLNEMKHRRSKFLAEVRGAVRTLPCFALGFSGLAAVTGSYGAPFRGTEEATGHWQGQSPLMGPIETCCHWLYPLTVIRAHATTNQRIRKDKDGAKPSWVAMASKCSARVEDNKMVLTTGS